MQVLLIIGLFRRFFKTHYWGKPSNHTVKQSFFIQAEAIISFHLQQSASMGQFIWKNPQAAFHHSSKDYQLNTIYHCGRDMFNNSIFKPQASGSDLHVEESVFQSCCHSPKEYKLVDCHSPKEYKLVGCHSPKEYKLVNCRSSKSLNLLSAFLLDAFNHISYIMHS